MLAIRDMVTLIHIFGDPGAGIMAITGVDGMAEAGVIIMAATGVVITEAVEAGSVNLFLSILYLNASAFLRQISLIHFFVHF